jgi:hypothetical protein
LVAVELDRLIAFCYDVTMPVAFMKLSSAVVACQEPRIACGRAGAQRGFIGEFARIFGFFLNW